MMSLTRRRLEGMSPIAALLLWCVPTFAQPGLVAHAPGDPVFGEPAGITMREPELPREDEGVDLWVKVGPSFSYTTVHIYYTTDGTEPAGNIGVAGTPSTRVLVGGVASNFVRNQPNGFGGNDDWWKATVPATDMARAYNRTIKYRVGVPWGTGNQETYLPAGAALSYTNKLAWPGAGAGQPNPGAGYPPISFWKEEAIFGNTFTAGMLDQNGTVYDMHFPTPGGVFGVGTRNEGYVDGVDTFPPLLPSGWRGQMHVNQAMAGIRVDGTTHWLSNPNGVSYAGVQQAYLPNSNTVRTTQSLGAANIAVEQFDFAPAGIAFPNNTAAQPERHIYLKRLILTNNGASAKTVNVYWYMDPALNGGDDHDTMFWDPARGAMTVYDKTSRTVTGTGNSFSPPNEYNPTTSPGYYKNIALYLTAAMKTAAGNVLAADAWRDTSGDNGQGWIGQQITLAPGVPQEVNILMAGSHFRPADPINDPMPGADGVYDDKLTSVLNWFQSASVSSLQTQTDAYWTDWLNTGTTVDFPDDRYDSLMKRGLLATALHTDGFNGGVIAGFHNGAYPYVWPRDAVYAAVTLARTGHLAEAEGVYSWMKNTTFRDFEGWGRKGFWKQKYSTDGYVIWGAPQIDETAVFPWGIYYQYRMTNSAAMLNAYIEQVRDAVLSCTQTSTVDPSRLNLTAAYPGAPGGFPGLMYSNNVWEDSYAPFVYSNANIVRGLRDAASIFDALGLTAERDNANTKASEFQTGLEGRLDWDGENTDISMLGVVHPFKVIPPTDFRATRLIERVDGTRTKFNNTSSPEPLVNAGGQHSGTVNRYWGDGYWNGGPWFLTTAWYGLFFAERADSTSGKADIDVHKAKTDLCIDRLGPAGFGAEQIAFDNSLMYPGQSDFTLQTAWPNAWESMSTFVDSVMAFLDYQPDAPANTMRIAPKLPSAWGTMTFKNVVLVNAAAGQTHNVDVAVTEAPVSGNHTVVFTNTNGHALNMGVTVKLPAGRSACSVRVNGSPRPYTPSLTGVTQISTFALSTGLGAITTLEVKTRAGSSPDFNSSGAITVQDLFDFLAAWFAKLPSADFNSSGGLPTVQDLFDFLAAWFAGCP